MFDKILLKGGETAYIVEIFDNGKAFLADIDRTDGTETDVVYLEDIDRIL